MCVCGEFVANTPESYDDVMMSRENSDIKKGILLFLSTFLHTTYFLLYIYIFFYSYYI